MRKKIIVIGMMLCLALSACSNKDKSENEKNTEQDNANQTKVACGQISVELDEDFESCRESLGEPKAYYESKSCLYDGYDKTYEYDDLIIITYPINGKEKIASITVLSEEVDHSLSISIGDSLDKIKSEYYEEKLDITDSCCIYEDGFGIAFYMEDDVVVEIEIYIL